jgi:hypothetical protein
VALVRRGLAFASFKSDPNERAMSKGCVCTTYRPGSAGATAPVGQAVDMVRRGGRIVLAGLKGRNLRSRIRCPLHAVYDRADSGGEAAAPACPLVEHILSIGVFAAELTEFSSSRICAGPIGVSVMWTPNASSACSIALMIAAAAGITPHSPTPFTPSPD